MPYYIRKSSGNTELFDTNKLRRSLQKAGAPNALITHIIDEIYRQKPKSSNEIHELVVRMLEDQQQPIAARYNLKRALMELGPAGFPFEQFAARVLDDMGYHTKTDQIVQGFCIDHEVDVIAQKDNQRIIVECKFHNQSGLKSDVKVTLYIQARFEDVQEAWKEEKGSSNQIHHAWIMTNTSFTDQAIQYALCKNISLTSWNYPENKGLAHLVDYYGLHPITALTTLSHRQKRLFIEHGFVLCKDVLDHVSVLRTAGFSETTIQKLIRESLAVCALPHGQ